jgi:hypothetical protein
MWGDFLLMSALCGYLVYLYGSQWSLSDLLMAGFIGLVVTIAMGYTFTLHNTPEAHMIDHQITKVGWVHLLYTWVALSVFLLFYFFTTTLDRPLIFITGVFVFAHVLLSTHIVVKAMALMGKIDWFPRQPLFDPIGIALLLILGTGLTWRSSQLLVRT